MIDAIQLNSVNLQCSGDWLLDEFTKLDNDLKNYIPFPPQGMTYHEAVRRVQRILDRINHLISRPSVQAELMQELEQNGMSEGMAQALIGKIQTSTDIDFSAASNKEARLDYINEQMTRVTTGLTPTPAELIQEYDQLWVALLQSGNPPSDAAVQKLLDFINANKEELLQVGDEMDLPICPGDSFAQDLNGLITGLQGYLDGSVGPDPLFEFSKDIAYELGILMTPQEVVNNFEMFANLFDKDANLGLAKELAWILSTGGYLNDLASLSKDPAQFKADAAKALEALKAYIANPSSGPQDAVAAIEQLLKDF